jgi:hypothetical protein
VIRHPTSPRARTLARAVESGSKARIERASGGLFRVKDEREAWDTSSEWLDGIRSAIHDAEAALRGDRLVPGR